MRRARARRLLVVVVPALLVVLVLGGLGARALLARRPDAAVLQSRPGPVLLVPGYGGGAGSLAPLASALRAAGRDVRLVTLPGEGTGDLREQAAALDEQVDDALGTAPGARAGSVDVVGFSAGGVVARLWASELDGALRARRVVSLGAPQHGTGTADLAAQLAGSACPPACRQLATSSPLLRELDAAGLPPGPAWLAVWSADDTVVTPPTSGRLEGAVNVELQEVCPGVRIEHGALPGAPLTVGLVLEALGADEGIDAPAPADCAPLTAAGRAALAG